jgi:hypothetical protein
MISEYLNEGESTIHCTLFPLAKVFSHWVFLARFLMRQYVNVELTLENRHPRGSVVNNLAKSFC